MPNIWSILTFVLIGVAVWTGYSEMAPENLRRANPDATFCTLVLIGMIVFSLGSVWYSVSGARQTTLRGPSWRRFSINWWRDPLQLLFESSCFAGAMAVGAAFRLRGTTETGFWMFMSFFCTFLGLLIGQLAVYAVYRQRIVQI